ncbi:hypothetical protein BH20ACI1_BH20ACI1_25630 [soil metagenome]
MKNSKLKFKNLSVLFGILYFAFCISGANAQSTRQEFPTPIITNEISGRIPARDIGDARLTNYFYTFNGNQGDVFINVQTTNLNGDIDIFTADNLKSLTKITIYSDLSENETGRVIYLRKPEKLILRIQGRTPNDDAATFRIKFAGSFQPLPATAAENSAPDLPEVKTETQTDVRVNSVGTIIEVKPKPTPAPKETVAKVEKKPKSKKPKPVAENIENPVEEPKKVEEPSENTKITIEKSAEENSPETEAAKESPKETQTDTSAKITISEETVNKNADEEVKKEDGTEVSEKIEDKSAGEIAESKPAIVKKPVRTRRGQAARTAAAKTATPKPPVPDPLENIRLTVLLKDGTKVEHRMSEILRFNIIKGVLTIIRKDGKIERYSILDVERTIIE